MSTLTIDPGAGVPPFEQLRRQLIGQIRSGELPEGTRLPAVRRLAADLAISPNTVARTYRELESEGYLITKGRGGTIVAPVPDAARLSDEFVATMVALELPEADIIEHVHQALSRRRKIPG